jgi:hypothetical protein
MSWTSWVRDAGILQTLKLVAILRAHIASATLSSMAVSRATRMRARVVHFVETSKQSRKVDVDDSEAAAVLTNFVLQCGESMPDTKQTLVVKSPHRHCRRSSRLLHLLGIQNDQPPCTNAPNNDNPTSNSVSLPSQFDCFSCCTP